MSRDRAIDCQEFKKCADFASLLHGHISMDAYASSAHLNERNIESGSLSIISNLLGHCISSRRRNWDLAHQSQPGQVPHIGRKGSAVAVEQSTDLDVMRVTHHPDMS